MGHSIAGSALAFIAFGVNLMGTGVLLLFNPRDRVLRWYAVFAAFLLGWLALQGTALAVDLNPRGWWWFGFVVSMLPVTFATVTLVQVLHLSDRAALALNAAAVLILLVVVRDPLTWRYQLLWTAIGWGIGAGLYLLRGRGSVRDRKGQPGRSLIDVTLNLIVPVGVVCAIVLRENFIVYGLPALTMITAFLVFVGVVRHRFYNIEVRAIRSGDIGVGAAEQERLALLGEFSASIAHEVRNPLTGMRSLAQRLRDEDVEEDKRTRYLDIILDEIGRLERIVSSLLDVARRPTDEGQSIKAPGEDVDVGTVFADLGLLVEARAKARGVRIVAQSNAVHVTTRREPLAQALLNLLLNAITHAPAGTSVELDAKRLDGDVQITVTDHGPGIARTEREAVFQPFHTASGGTGLGLAVVRRLARENDWKIEIDDAVGGGAALRICIPTESASPA